MQSLIREPAILGFSCVVWESRTFILVCGRHQQPPGTKPPSRNSAHNHKSYQREGRRETHREGAHLGYNLKTTYKSSSAVGPLNLISQHGFATCIQRAIAVHILHGQMIDFRLVALCMFSCFGSSDRRAKQACHMSQYL